VSVVGFVVVFAVCFIHIRIIIIIIIIIVYLPQRVQQFMMQKNTHTIKINPKRRATREV